MSTAKAKKSVLIVDDEPEVRVWMKELLAQTFTHASFYEANNGSEALNKMAIQKFDLLITDLQMPKVDGAKLLDSLATLKPEQRPAHIVVVSGNLDADTSEALPETIQRFSKPVNVERLVKALQPMLAVAPAAEGPQAKIDAQFIAPFIQGTLSVLEVMAKVKVEKESTFLKKDGHVSGDISAVIAMNSDIFLGSMSIAFEKPLFLAIVEGMLGEKFTNITPEIEDACGELCNQIFGFAKQELNKQGHKILPALPSVVVAPHHTVKHAGSGPCLGLSFKSPHGRMVIEAVIQPIGPTK